MEGALKAERDRAENYLNIAEVIFIALDTYARITLINRKGYEILDYEEDELIGKDWIKTFLRPEDYERVIDFNNKIIAGKIEPLEYYESYILTKKGEERNIAWHTAVLKNDEGYIIGTLSSGEDITDRRRAEEALKEGEEKYRNLVERANAGITIIQDGTVRYANPALTKLWGGSVEEIVGRPFTDFIDPDEIPNVIERYQLRMANKNVSPIYETILRHRNGTKIFVELNAGLITFQETPADLVIVQNITERKWAAEEVKKARDELEIRVRERTAELEAKNAEMERFIYTVSHELRSPLISASGIVGFLRQDLEEGDAKRTETDLKLIEGAMTKMDQLLGEILELSRIGRVANPPVDVPFGEIVMETLDQEAEKLKSRGVEVSMASDLPKVHVDRMRIMEVLVNLIDNSIKYMGDQPRPRIEVGHRLDNNQTIFIVRDNGMGIDPSQHEKVFGLFYKVNGKSEGTGVGLAIVKRIIEVHGGRIWIESELGQGCTVYFTLPIADVG
jgi:PAS domain S-box-containing protein